MRLAFKGTPRYAVGTPLEVSIDADTHRQVVVVPFAAVVHEGGEAAVFVPTGVARARAQVLGAAATILAIAAGPAQPR